MTLPNLDALDAATADLSSNDYRNFHSYLIGVLSAQTDAETWQRALDATSAFVKRGPK